MIDEIVTWRIKSEQWDIYTFYYDIAHSEVLSFCQDVNAYFEQLGSDLRVRKSWKSLEACTVEDSHE